MRRVLALIFAAMGAAYRGLSWVLDRYAKLIERVSGEPHSPN